MFRLVKVSYPADLFKEYKSEIKNIYTAFMLDDSERTYCCELTPSYYLDPVCTGLEVYKHVSGERQEELWELVCAGGVYPCYMHCSDVETLECELWKGESPEDADEAREFWQGNPPF